MDQNRGSRTALIRKMIGNDYYDLKLDFDGLVELQDRCFTRTPDGNYCSVGPYYIWNRLREVEVVPTGAQLSGNWNPEWIYETIRIGLVRAGLNPRDAIKLCDQYIRGGFIMDYLAIAVHALDVGLHGPEDEPLEADSPGEPMTEANDPTPSDE